MLLFYFFSSLGFLLDKKPGVHQPKRVENARILIANTPMDADKVKIFGSRITLDSVAKLGEMEAVENEKMKAKVFCTLLKMLWILYVIYRISVAGT